uniref:Uncharacterized protein n=1 Tax=Rhizophora mucronata TaxID=61149 RepID=A0A2P2PA65_RHIMU
MLFHLCCSKLRLVPYNFCFFPFS